MNCEQAKNLFDAYLDGELSPSLETEFGAHRLNCAHCRHRLALMEVAGHVIGADSGGDVELPADFTERLLACIDRPRRASKPSWKRRIWVGGSVLAAAACMALVFNTWLFGHGRRVAGVRAVSNTPAVDPDVDVASDPEFDRAFESVVRQFESTWSTRAQSTNQIIELGDMMIMQILDRFGIDEAIEQAEPYGVMPDSFDEFAPPVPTEDDVEDL